MNNRVVSHASIQFRQEQQQNNFAQSWARNAPFRMPNHGNAVQRNCREESESVPIQWDQSRNCTIPQHQQYTIQSQHNTFQQQYNQKYSDELQITHQGYQIDPKEHARPDEINGYVQNMQNKYNEQDYPDTTYDPSNYSKCISRDYTFNNQNEHNTSFDERTGFGGNYSAVIRIGDGTDIESTNESYALISQEPGLKKMQEQQSRKICDPRYSNPNSPNYTKRFVTASTRFDGPVTCDQNSIQVQSPYKKVTSLSLKDDQQEAKKLQRNSLQDQIEDINISTTLNKEFLDDQYPIITKCSNIMEPSCRNNYQDGTNQEVLYESDRAQVHCNVRHENNKEGNTQDTVQKKSFGTLQNQQRRTPTVPNHTSTNPFAKKQSKKENHNDFMTETNCGTSVQNAIARFNNKAQQNWVSQMPHKKKEKFQTPLLEESRHKEPSCQENDEATQEKRTQILSLQQKHEGYYENIHQVQDYPLKQRGDTNIQENDTIKKTSDSGTPQEEASLTNGTKGQSAQSKNSLISTDSALSSDDTFPNPPTSVSGGSFHLKDGKKNVLDAEAKLLLCYFKTHRAVLNYLNIGLADSLWVKVNEMPNCKVELRIADEIAENTKKMTTRERILRRVSSKSKNPKEKSSNKNKESSITKSESVKVQQPPSSANIVKPSKSIQYPQRNDSSDDEQLVTAKDERLMLHDYATDDDQQIIQDFEDVNKQMNSSRPTSASTISNEPKRQPTDEYDDGGSLTIDKDESNFEDVQDNLHKTEEAVVVPHDPEKRYTPPLNYDEDIKSESRSGRFMKKSAAALIARKQTSVTNSPVSMHKGFHKRSLTVDPQHSLTREQKTESRIAAEIRNLKEREEELRRSRSELGLPSLEDIVDTWKSPANRTMHQQKNSISSIRYGVHSENKQHGGLSSLRDGRSYDHLQATLTEVERSKTEPRVAKSESFHHLHASLDLMGQLNKSEEGYYTHESKARLSSNSNNEQRVNDIHKARKVRLAVQDSTHTPVNPKVKHVEVKVRATEAANIAQSTRRGAPPRLRRNYVEEYPSVRL